MQELLREITKANMKEEIPAFRPGDTVRVHLKVIEGQRERIQVFEGVVIKRRDPELVKLLPFVRFLTA